MTDEQVMFDYLYNALSAATERCFCRAHPYFSPCEWCKGASSLLIDAARTIEKRRAPK